MATEKKLSATIECATKVTYAALSIIRDHGGEMQMRDCMDEVARRVDFTDFEKATYAKSGYVRWQSVLHFYSIDCVKAGFLVKKKGVWYTTPECEEALKLGPAKFLEAARKGYSDWKAKQPKKEADDETVEPVVEGDDKTVAFEEVEQKAMEGLERYVAKLNAYEFQDLVAALLRGMGYYTPFVAPKGKDGGIDVVAYRDPLGTQSPRIQVQIKHRESTASVMEVRQLMGLLQKEGDVGMFVSTSGFSPDARAAARSSHVHVELVDLNRFIAFWLEFYGKLTDEDKALMPLKPIYFLA